MKWSIMSLLSTKFVQDYGMPTAGGYTRYQEGLIFRLMDMP